MRQGQVSGVRWLAQLGVSWRRAVVRRCVWLCVVVCVFVGVFVVGVGGAGAVGLSPWLHVGSESLPSFLAAGGGTSEVQRVVVEAGKGDWYLGGENVGELLERHDLVEHLLPFDASAEEVRVQLEELLPGNRVEVRGLGAGGGSPFEVTFPGQVVPVVKALSFPFGVELECGVLELAGFGSCGGDTTRVFGPLKEAGVGVEPVVSELQKGSPGDQISVNVVNVGDASGDMGAVPLRVADVLPKGFRALSIEESLAHSGSLVPVRRRCSVVSVSCTASEGALPAFLEQATVTIGVAVEPGEYGGEPNVVEASGAGAPSVRASQPLTLAKTPGEATPFGVEHYEMSSEEPGGAPDRQAGSHPFQTTFSLDLNERPSDDGFGGSLATPAQLAKDLSFNLPAGFVGDPTAYPRCTLQQFTSFPTGSANECPAGSALGIAVVTFREENETSALKTVEAPVFNLEPSEGEPARFGFEPLSNLPVFLGTSVRTGGDYGVTAHLENALQTVGFTSSVVTLWGVPADARHNLLRGYGCLQETVCEPGPGKGLPFLSLPTSCTGQPLQSTIEGISWQQAGEDKAKGLPEQQQLLAGAENMPTLDGCGLPQFGSEINVSTDEETTSTPSGLNVDVHVPQEPALNPEGLAPADVKTITVTLPEGLALNPSSGDGLAACTLEQAALNTPEEPSCPNASKIANATITTPLLPNPLKGFLYLASPQNFAGPLQNPFGTLFAVYLVVKDPVSGVLVKLAGKIEVGGQPGVQGLADGQIRSTFADNPQLPFEDARIEFFGGERAPLATPAHCGPYTTNATFEPWTNGATIHELLASSSQFDITSGPQTLTEPQGSPCPGTTLPFTPSLSSGTTSNNAGSFSPLTTTLSREDGQQSIRSVTLHYPTGISGILTGVKLCPEAQANTGSCPPQSQIGETIVSVGLGGDPYTVTGGKVYLTEHYHGAPFGLSIVNPAKAGPFTLQEGRPVVVRATIQIDPHTTALTITTDPTGPHAIPSTIEGIPLQIKHVNVTITRHNFTFNPTNCNPTQIQGTITSDQNTTSPLQLPFQATNCAALKFNPTFTATTNGHTTKTTGASLTITVTRPAGPETGQANFAETKVSLPKQLPSRLTTLQKACLATTFQTNPANCPPGSIVGHATTNTPLLPVPLEGPAYFVSHGGEAFPNLIIILQGYGITAEIISTTYINKQGITTATLKNLPDAPFTTFQLTLPQGPNSALAANTNLCNTKLTIPTELTPQNNTPPTHQNTPIHTTNCPTKHHKHHKHTHKH